MIEKIFEQMIALFLLVSNDLSNIYKAISALTISLTGLRDVYSEDSQRELSL
jgi:hypothetical protein